MKLALFPLILSSSGILAAFIGIGLVKVKPGRAAQQALNRGTFGAAGIAAVFSFILTFIFLKGEGEISYLSIFLSSVLGMIAGSLIGILTEYYTGTDTKPVLKIVKACETGAATTLITGMGVGMMSTFFPIVVIVSAILLSFFLPVYME